MAHVHRPPTPGRLRRLAEELAEVGYGLERGDPTHELLLEEIDLALRPPVHERRVPSLGSIVDPRSPESTWEPGTELSIAHGAIGSPVPDARRFADGLSSWLIRRPGGPDEWCVFDRPAGSERDLVVLSNVMAATIVQRHPAGAVRVAGAHGVLRWDGLTWRLEPPIEGWVASLQADGLDDGDAAVLHALLDFAVHDLGSRGIGAILVHHPDEADRGSFEERLPTPPPLQVLRPTALAPLTHALRQVDGAAIFDATGTLRQLGVRLVPSPEAADQVEGIGGTRHTSGRRYSYDDPRATVIVVSEDGPVSVWRAGQLVGTSPPAIES
jgi:hypothetical protein